MINWVNECGREFKEYIIYVTEFRFLKEIFAAAVLSHILSSRCIFEFPSQPIPNHTRVNIGQDIRFSSTNTPARGKAPCLGTTICF